MKKFYLALLISVLMILTACSSNSAEGNSEKESKGDQVIEKSTENDLSKDGVDQEKFDEVLREFPTGQPERIVTTSVPIAEMLSLLEVMPIGVPTSTNPMPAEFDAVERIGSPMQPDLEVVTSLEPDLILGAESLRSTLEKSLEGIELGRTYLPTESFDDLKLSFKVLGTYFDKQNEMNQVLDSIVNKENALMERAKGKELPSVMLMIGTADSFMVMSERSYLGSLVKKLGADNIATSVLKVEDTYSPINMEDVVVADPDIILVLASGDHGASEDMFQKEVDKNELWKKMSAYKNEQVHILDYETFGVTSIRNVEEALTQIANYFYESTNPH